MPRRRRNVPLTHPVPAGITALYEAGMTVKAFGRVLGGLPDVSSRWRLIGKRGLQVIDLVMLAKVIGCEPAELFSADVAKKIVPELLDPRLEKRRIAAGTQPPSRKKRIRRESSGYKAPRQAELPLPDQAAAIAS